MKRQIAVTGLVACALFIPLRNQAKSPAPADAIRQNEVMWNKDFEARDVAKLLAHYTDDATLMAPGMAAAHGKDTIAKALQAMISDYALTLKFQATRVEVSKSGDMAYTEGTYSMTMTNPATGKPMSDKGSYVTVYKKQADGSWKAVSDIATSESMPTT